MSQNQDSARRINEPDPTAATYHRPEDVQRVMDQLQNDPNLTAIHLRRYAGDWGLGEGDWWAFVAHDKPYGLISLTLAHRHSRNIPLGASPSILEVITLEIPEAIAHDFADEVRWVSERRGG